MAGKKKQQKEESQKRPPRLLGIPWLRVARIGAIVLAVLCFVVFGSLAYAQFQYHDRIFPGVHIGNVSFGGLTQGQAAERLAATIQVVESSGIVASSDKTSATIDSTVNASGLDSAFPLFTYDDQATIAKLLSFGRTSNGLRNVFERIKALLGVGSVAANVSVENQMIQDQLKAQFGKEENPPKSSHFEVQNGTLIATVPSSGIIFSYDAYDATIEDQLQKLQSPHIHLTLQKAEPAITQAMANAVVERATSIVAAAPYSITYGDKSWSLSQQDVLGSIDIALQNKAPHLVFTESGLKSVLDKIKKDVEVLPQDSKFLIQNGKVSEFQTSQEGIAIDVPGLITSLQSIITGTAKSVALKVIKTDPKISKTNSGDLGITELVATATTNFKGSPSNRIHNITNGAKLLNGILIKPGETFSTISALKPIDTSNGYLPELVIKGNRTLPEVGGGLCQIGTTMFRVTMNAGLPVVERQNHSYRVSYYEPPVGMDATIYDPKPDFRFTNDYESYLLLMARVEGTSITFELWGTKDGRTQTQSTPKLYNVTSPGPTKYIESADLKPGEKKLVEHAHKGGTAEFTYTITYPDGHTKSQTYVSKYKAWQEVYLVGPTKKTTNTNTNTSTNKNTNTQTNANTAPVTNTVVNQNVNALPSTTNTNSLTNS